MSTEAKPHSLKSVLAAPVAVGRHAGRKSVDAYVASASRVVDAEDQLVSRARPAAIKAVGELQVAVSRRLITESAAVQRFLIG